MAQIHTSQCNTFAKFNHRDDTKFYTRFRVLTTFAGDIFRQLTSVDNWKLAIKHVALYRKYDSD